VWSGGNEGFNPLQDDHVTDVEDAYADPQDVLNMLAWFWILMRKLEKLGMGTVRSHQGY
jgi:hypothetical protein